MIRLKPKIRKGEDQKQKQKVDTNYSKILKPHRVHRLHPNTRNHYIQALICLRVLRGVNKMQLHQKILKYLQKQNFYVILNLAKEIWL